MQGKVQFGSILNQGDSLASLKFMGVPLSSKYLLLLLITTYGRFWCTFIRKKDEDIVFGHFKEWKTMIEN